MKNHSVWMIILCVLPMLLIFVLPAFGMGNSGWLLLLLLLCVGSHLLMMRGHHHGAHGTPHDHQMRERRKNHEYSQTPS